MAEDRSVLSRPAPAPESSHRFGSDPDQVFDLFPADSESAARFPPVVLIHGGYWRPEYDRSHARSAAAGLAHAGWTTALPEYRRIPGDPEASVQDVMQSIAAIIELTNASKVLLVGHSAGGHLALVAASALGDKVAGVLALAPLSNLSLAEARNLDDGAVTSFLGAPAADRRDLDPMHLTYPQVPIVLMHGAADSVVPVDMSRNFTEKHQVSLVVLEDIGHFEPIDPQSSAWSHVLETLTSVSTRSSHLPRS